MGLVPTSAHSPSPSYVAVTMENQATICRAAVSLNSLQTFDRASKFISRGSDPGPHCPYGCHARAFLMTRVEKEALELLEHENKGSQ